MAYKYSSRRLLSTPNDDSVESYRRSPSPARTSVGDRLRQKIDSSSLPGRTDRHRTNVRNSDSDFPSKISSAGDDASSYSPRSRNADTQNYKKLYEDNLKENERLKTELADAQRKISELETRLEKAEEGSTRKQALDNEKRERRVLEQKLAEMEKELQKYDGAEDLKKSNGHLKAENDALQRIVEKLGGGVAPDVDRLLGHGRSKTRQNNDATPGSRHRSESSPELIEVVSSVDRVEGSPPGSPAPLSRSSSSTSLSEGEKLAEARRGSGVSSQGSDLGVGRAGSSSSASSYSLRRDRNDIGSASPRRPLTSNYGSAYDSSRSNYLSSRYGTKNDSTTNYTTGYNSLPRASSSSRRDYSKSTTAPTTGSTSTSYQRPGSSYRSTPAPYSSTGSKSSYTTNSRSRYTPSTAGITGTSSPSKYSSLSRYATGQGSSRRPTKF